MTQEAYGGQKTQEGKIPAAFMQEGPIEEKADKEKTKNKFLELDRYIDIYTKEPGQLIIILKKAQDIFGYLSEQVQAYIAEKTSTPVSEVNGVVTFYSFFLTEPQGKYTLDLCTGTACYIKGAQKLMEILKDSLQIDAGETTQDNLFTINTTRCIGACGLAPIVIVNGNVHGNTSPDEIKKIIRKCRKGEEIADKNH